MVSKVNQIFKEMASRRCEEILRGYNVEGRREICRRLSDIKSGLMPEIAESIDECVEEMNVLEADKEEYLYIKAFLDGLKFGQE